jgi:hypothetical protein
MRMISTARVHGLIQNSVPLSFDAASVKVHDPSQNTIFAAVPLGTLFDASNSPCFCFSLQLPTHLCERRRQVLRELTARLSFVQDR